MSTHNTPFSQQIAFMSRGVLDDELTEELAAAGLVPPPDH